jgi:hypothetical protein
MKSLCRALLVLNVLYCLLAAAQEGLPGWHMFESVEAIDHELTDRNGRALDVRAWLPRGANVVDRAELHRIVMFVCKKEPDRAPFVYAEGEQGGWGKKEPSRGFRTTLGDDCKVHVNASR